MKPKVATVPAKVNPVTSALPENEPDKSQELKPAEVPAEGAQKSEEISHLNWEPHLVIRLIKHSLTHFILLYFF